MQDYMGTGLGSAMEKANIPNIEEWMKKYRSVFEEYYNKTLYPEPKKVELGW